MLLAGGPRRCCRARGGRRLALRRHAEDDTDAPVERLRLRLDQRARFLQQLLDEAVGKDPGYPLNYYNRACAFAEEGDKSKVLTNLDLAFQRKANVLKGEQMPNSRAHSSFQKYVRDPEFLSFMKNLGLP